MGINEGQEHGGIAIEHLSDAQKEQTTEIFLRGENKQTRFFIP